MSTQFDAQEILKRLQALEEENARLRKATTAKETKPLTVTESEYKGHPTLVFEGPCRPFSLGYKKLSLIKQAWPQVEQFLQKHFQSKAGQPLTDYDDDQI